MSKYKTLVIKVYTLKPFYTDRNQSFKGLDNAPFYKSFFVLRPHWVCNNNSCMVAGLFAIFEFVPKTSSVSQKYKSIRIMSGNIYPNLQGLKCKKQARNSSEDAPAGYAQFEKVWAG